MDRFLDQFNAFLKGMKPSSGERWDRRAHALSSRGRGWIGFHPLCVLVLVGLALSGCSPRRFIIKSAADAVSTATSTAGHEDDPEFILEALPFALFSLESLAEQAPDHAGIRATLASGFVQYAFLSEDLPAFLTKFEDFKAYRMHKERARKRYLRGMKWGLEGLDIRVPGFSKRLSTDPTGAVAELGIEDIDLMYWTGTGLLAAMSVDRPDLMVRLPEAVALLERALALDPDYDGGGLHELFIALDMSRGEGLGGGRAKARAHFERALELTEGKKASLFVTYATAIAVPDQDRSTFDEMIERALAIDTSEDTPNRLSNILAQRQAEYLKAHIEDLFDDALAP